MFACLNSDFLKETLGKSHPTNRSEPPIRSIQEDSLRQEETANSWSTQLEWKTIYSGLNAEKT